MSQKLMLISVFFLMPDSLMLYLFVSGINGNIEFARLELKGNEYQRPLEDLLEAIPEHERLVQGLADGGVKAERVAQIEARIESALNGLEAVDARWGVDLQFTPEGLAKRQREHYRVSTLRREWQSLAHLRPVHSVESTVSHQHLVTDLRAMITHAGDNSNLILDPDLDSYYLMDATLLGLPQTQQRIAEVMVYGQALIDKRKPVGEASEMRAHAALLEEADMRRIASSVRAALNEDVNFHGVNESLRRNLLPLLEEYEEAAAAFNRLTARLAEPEKSAVDAKQYAEAGARALHASFRLWEVAAHELDSLLEKRIEHYQHRRTLSLLVSACALLAAICFVRFITVSISRPLRRQADELRTANASLQLEIAERERAEERLRKSEEHFRLITENAADLITILDAEGHQLYCSPSYSRLLGHAPEALTGARGILDLIHLEDREGVFSVLKNVVHAAVDQVVEYRVRHRDDSWRIFESHLAPFRDAAGRVEGALVVARDVTERKEAERARQLLEVQLRQAQKLEAVGQLSAGIAHEINTPTQYVGDNTRFLKDSFESIANVLHAHGDLLQAVKEDKVSPDLIARVEEALAESDSGYLFEQIPEAIRQTLEGVERVTKIVRAMKEFSHPGSQEKVLTDINRAVETAVTVASGEWKHVAEIQLDLDPDLPEIPCLVSEFNQCVLNLLINASHAIEDVVKSQPGSKGTITLRTRQQGDSIEVSISDTGTGIPEAVRSRIFEPFFTTKEVGRGSGQGLSIVYGNIVKQHAGQVRFETELGKGSTFFLLLPVQAGDAKSEEPQL